jgi:chromosome segregation ATPase
MTTGERPVDNGTDSKARLDRVEKLLESAGERLDRAGERTDAIAQSVELLAIAQRESESRIAKLEEGMVRLEGHMTTLIVTMDRLANVVIRHEERLDRLDGGDA